MEFFPLPVFPQGSLASSVITTVWVGVFVAAFFNLRLGWVLSGLVVPGYLVPLMLVKPWAAATIFLEGCLTYFLVWLFSEYLSRWAGWSNFFGRDRFFALVLCSILVRLIFDVWLLPAVGEAVATHFSLSFDYRNNLHSFGLVVVSLLANQFWKPGFVRGLPPILTTLGITYLLVRYGLMELTNFSIGNLEYLYEDIATSILASPKAYIILVMTAFLSSRMNLRYGWDFNGILIPALIALQWYQPLKVLVTFVEASLLLVIALFVLRAPLFQKVTMEGARKLVLFFNLSFAYKMALGYALLWLAPRVKVTDFYAFGYLLSTLVAMKMHDKHIFARLSRSTLQISLVGVALASALGFLLTFLPTTISVSASPPVANSDVRDLPDTRLIDVLREDKVALYQLRAPDSVPLPFGWEIELFTAGVRAVAQFVEQRSPELLLHARSVLAKVNYRIDTVQNRYLYLCERPPQRGWGIYVFDLYTRHPLVVEVPAPLDEKDTMEAGTSLFLMTNGRALAIAGTGREVNRDGSTDVLANRQTFFQGFHQEVARRDAVQVRGYTTETLRVLSGARRGFPDSELPEWSSSLWVKSALPQGLDLAVLKRAIDTYRIEWGEAPLANIQRDTVRSRFAELLLSRADLRKLLFTPMLTTQEVELRLQDQRIDGYLQEWLLSGKGKIAEGRTNLYTPPKPEELLFFDREVLVPLLSLARTAYVSGQWSPAGVEELRTIAAAAATLGYQIIRYRHRESGHDYLILTEREEERRYWGTYVLRLGAANNFIIQVPRPLFEINTFEYGVSTFERLQARALLIGGTHPRANVDGSADLIDLRNKGSLFSLVNQVLLREAHDEPMLAVQCRALGQRSGTLLQTADLLVTFGSGVTPRGALAVLGETLLRSFAEDGLTARFAEGAADTTGYEASGSPQALYLSATQNKGLVILWLSPLLRTSYRQQTENQLQALQFRALGIPTVESDLYRYIAATQRQEESVSRLAALRTQIQQYVETHDVIRLRQLQLRWPDARFARLLDPDSRQAFLLVSTPSGTLFLVANLSLREPQRSVRVPTDAVERDAVLRFIESRASWLEFGAAS